MSKADDFQAEFNKHMNALWASYLAHCRHVGVAPVSRVRFAEGVAEHMGLYSAARSIAGALQARNMTELQPSQKGIYIGVSLRGRKMTDLRSIPKDNLKECAQCHSLTLIDADQYNKVVARMEMIICSDCVPEISGKPVEEHIMQQLKDMEQPDK